MRGEDEGDVVQLFGEEACHRDIPGMRVDDVYAVERLDLREVETHGFERGREFLRLALVGLVPRLRAANVEVAIVGILIAPAVDFDFDFSGELAAEVFDVPSGAAVDVRR